MTGAGKLVPGLKGSARTRVTDQHTAPHVGSGKIKVLATPVMVNLMEAAALQAVEGMLPKNRLSRQTMTRLKVYVGPDHPHAAQKPQVLEL